jgi:hypothetical protein
LRGRRKAPPEERHREAIRFQAPLERPVALEYWRLIVMNASVIIEA